MNTATQAAVWFPAVRAASGADTFTESLAESLRQRGFRAEVTWLPHRAEYAPWTVRVPTPPAWTNVIHANSWLPARFLPQNLPLVATMHLCVHDPALSPYKTRAQSLYHRLWIRRLEKAMLFRANTMTAVSNYTAKCAQEIFGGQEAAVIPNGVRLNVFEEAPNRQQHHPFRLLYAGNWSTRKGSELLAPIMEVLGSDFELLYTSDRAGAPAAAGLPPNSRSLGRLPSEKAMAEAYRSADALLFPTRLEGLPLAPIEAHACGLPVIATNGSSLPEVIDDGVTGILCPQDDISAFAEAARRLASNPTQWLAMSRAARKRAEEKFDSRLMVDRYIAVYETLLRP